MSTIRIPLSSRQYPGMFALIDEQDAELVSGFTWHPFKGKGGTFYAKARDTRSPNPRARVYMHQLILGTNPGELGDHIDGDGLNNTRSNLRIVTPTQNAHNIHRYPRNTSGYIGVSRWPRGLWQAGLKVNGKRQQLGIFETALEAALAYDAAVRHFRGEIGMTNEKLGRVDPSQRIPYQEKSAALNRNNTSGFRGVARDGGRWRAVLVVDGKQIHLGSFGTPREAALAYDAGAVHHYGPDAITNESLGLLAEVAR